MTAPLTTDQADTARPMILVQIPDGSGGFLNEFRPAPPEKPKQRRKQAKPDPIEANPETAAQQLKMFIERLEKLREERAEISFGITDVLNEAKACGYDKKTINRILTMRQEDPNLRAEDEALLETYKTALGLE
ncbi:MAG: DUF2312 domain-containing protein [Sphingobium sp.]